MSAKKSCTNFSLQHQSLKISLQTLIGWTDYCIYCQNYTNERNMSSTFTKTKKINSYTVKTFGNASIHHIKKHVEYYYMHNISPSLSGSAKKILTEFLTKRKHLIQIHRKFLLNLFCGWMCLTRKQNCQIFCCDKWVFWILQNCIIKNWRCLKQGFACDITVLFKLSVAIFVW